MPSKLSSRNQKIIWDDEEYQIDLSLISNVTINGKSLRDFLSLPYVRISQVEGNKISISLKNLFGTIRITFPEKKEQIKVVPKKLFDKTDTPEQGYKFVQQKVLRDIGNLITMLVKETKDIQASEVFKIVLKQRPWSIEFLVIALERYLKMLEGFCLKLFNYGPVHKDLLKRTSYFGSTAKLSNKLPFYPYLEFHQNTFTYDTYLNKMLFQAFYFIILESELLYHFTQDKSIKERVRKVEEESLSFLNRFHLWEFFHQMPLNLAELQQRVLTQQNPYYLKILEVYKEITKLLFSKTTLEIAEEGLEYPLLNFAYLYEAWAISRILDSLQKHGYTLKKESLILGNRVREYNRRARASFIFSKGNTEIRVVWELKFKPRIDSLYLKSLIESIQELPEEVKKIRIKPDLLMIKKERGKIQKILLGDVKFRVDEKNQKLPRLGDIYKILGYILDLREFRYFKNAQIEGILIYPGKIKMLKIPIIDPKNNKEIIYINLVPLNSHSYEFNFEFI